MTFLAVRLSKAYVLLCSVLLRIYFIDLIVSRMLGQTQEWIMIDLQRTKYR